MLLTSQDKRLLFLNNSNFLQIHDKQSLEPNKILKIGNSIIKAVDKLTDDILVLGCSHGKLTVYSESYSSTKQIFEAHNDSIISITVNPEKVILLILEPYFDIWGRLHIEIMENGGWSDR